MTHTPEVTTALALMAELIEKDERFPLLPIMYKAIVLHCIARDLCDLFHIREEQRMEFLERYKDTIIKPWCYEDLENDAR